MIRNSTLLTPEAAFYRALKMLRTRPGTLILKAGTSLFSSFSAILTAVFVLLVVLFWFLKPEAFGLPLIIGIAGIVTVIQGLSAGVDAVAWSAIWGQGRSMTRGEPITYEGCLGRYFVKAVGLRLFVYMTNVFLVITWVLVSVATWIACQQLSLLFSVWVGALFGGLVLTLLAVFIGLARLSVEMTTVVSISDDLGLGEALVQCTNFVVNNLIAVYRVLVQAVSALLIPLVFYYLAIFVQNLAVHSPALSPLAVSIRFLAEVFMMVGFAGFAILTHFGFLNLWWSSEHSEPAKLPDGQIELMIKRRQIVVSLDDLLPKSTPNIVKLDELFLKEPPPLAPEDADPEEEMVPGDPPQRFDLKAVLKPESHDSDPDSD